MLHPGEGRGRWNVLGGGEGMSLLGKTPDPSCLWLPQQPPTSPVSSFCSLHPRKANLSDVHVSWFPWNGRWFLHLVASLSSFNSTGKEDAVQLSICNDHPTDGDGTRENDPGWSFYFTERKIEAHERNCLLVNWSYSYFLKDTFFF